MALGRGPLQAVRFSRVELPRDVNAPGQARRAVELHLGGVIEDGELNEVRLMAGELVSNAVEHHASGERVVIYLAASGRRVRVEVVDGGSGFELPLAMPPEGATRGYGLRLIDEIASTWGLSGDHGTCVWFELECEVLPAT